MRVKSHMNKTLQNGINSVRFSELLKLFREVKSTSAGRLLGNFLLVINSKAMRTSYHFRYMDALCSTIACFPTSPLFDAP